ncbi:MAG: hypothetical protein RI601_00985 [Desulfurivibrionaceae bacterium]|nr:hypothetical protein [Desulfurivibrionaceae bacterium]
MPNAASFKTYHHRYDDWFVCHAAAYHSELLAVRAQMPWQALAQAASTLRCV